jgi:signal transduction histidine kinase/CheY-like chemotaxis protein
MAANPVVDPSLDDADRVLEDMSAARRRLFSKYCLQLTLASALLFYFLDHPGYDHRIYLFSAALCLVLMVLLRRGFSTLYSANAVLLTVLLTLTWAAAQTGGVNSSKNLWFSLLPMVALLTVGRTAAVWWLGLISLVQCGLMWAGMRGLIDTRVDWHHMIAWGIFNQVCVVGSWVFGVHLYERMYRQQVQANEQHNQALEATHDDLQRAQAHKDEFIASVGHELRTPMNAILGFNGILHGQLADRPDDVAVVDHIRVSTERLLQVVNDILDFSQLQAGRLVLHAQEFDLTDAVTSALKPYRELAQRKGLAMNVEMPFDDHAWVYADKGRFQQILQNLVDNAIKFTDQGLVSVSVVLQDTHVRVAVQDTGIGIAEDRQQVIFDRFEHANIQTNRQYGGTGLGMSICERLVTLQGGTLGVRSHVGEGAYFWFTLPMPMVAMPTLASQDWASLTQEPLNFLLVDDNAVNLLVAGLMLKKHFPNATVQQTDTGEHALTLLREQHFDLVLMDMMMPDMDGLEATRTLRQTFPSPICDVPVLALTASVNPVDRERCLGSGMDDVLYKPLDPVETVQHICKFLSRHRQAGVSA